MLQEKRPVAQEISHDFRIFDAVCCHHCLLFGDFSKSQTEQKKRSIPHEKQVSTFLMLWQCSWLLEISFIVLFSKKFDAQEISNDFRISNCCLRK